MTRFDESDLPKVFELATNGIDLLIEHACKLSNEVFTFRIQQECGEKFHSCLTGEECFENDNRGHVQKEYSVQGVLCKKSEQR